MTRWRWLGLVTLAGCALPLRNVGVAPVAEVTSLSLSFSGPEQGRLDFVVEVPDAAGAEVPQLSWELWLSQWRFASGVEGRVLASPTMGGRLRCAVSVPLLARHMGWSEGQSDVEVGLRGDVRLTGATQTVMRFERHQVLRLNGRPVRDDGS